MSSSDKKLAFNERDCEYDYYGDTRNNLKFNEERPYAKNSYNFKVNKKIYLSKLKKETQKESYEEEKHKQEFENKEKEELKEIQAIHNKERKRQLKITEKENENYENNFEKIEKKPKKVKKPRKGRIRF